MSQQDFAAALLDPDLAVPAGLTAWNGSDPAQRFRVYRNNVIVALIDALAGTFEVTQELVGENFFHAMARRYAYAHPPRSRLMAVYGASFPAFIETFPPTAGLPYLADVASARVPPGSRLPRGRRAGLSAPTRSPRYSPTKLPCRHEA